MIAQIIRHVKRFYGTDRGPGLRSLGPSEKRARPPAPYLLQGSGHPSPIAYARSAAGSPACRPGARAPTAASSVLRPHDCRRLFASELLNNNIPVHVIEALLGHAGPDTVMVYAKLYPATLVEEYRKAVRAAYADFHGPDSLRAPTRQEWRRVRAQLSTARHGHAPVRAADRRHCPRPGLPRLQPRPAQTQRGPGLPSGCSAATNKRSSRADRTSLPGRSPHANSRSNASRAPCAAPESSTTTSPRPSRPPEP